MGKQYGRRLDRLRGSVRAAAPDVIRTADFAAGGLSFDTYVSGTIGVVGYAYGRLDHLPEGHWLRTAVQQPYLVADKYPAVMLGFGYRVRYDTDEHWGGSY